MEEEGTPFTTLYFLAKKQARSSRRHVQSERRSSSALLARTKLITGHSRDSPLMPANPAELPVERIPTWPAILSF